MEQGRLCVQVRHIYTAGKLMQCFLSSLSDSIM